MGRPSRLDTACASRDTVCTEGLLSSSSKARVRGPAAAAAAAGLLPLPTATTAAAAAPVVARAAGAAPRPHDRRRPCVRTQAWFGQAASRKLWDYEGSSVKQLSLQELQLLHRLSFGHRNQRSYLVVVYRADSPACQALEAELERLAAGLRHEPAFVAGALEASGREAAGFAEAMLGVSSVPCVLLYPEAARGCLKFLGPDMSAVGMLAAINKARSKAMPATAGSPVATQWELLEAATPLAMTSFRAAAASGSTEAMVASLQQQMRSIEPTPLMPQQAPGLWSRGRAQLWGVLLLASLAFLAWDLVLADVWEDWCLARRQVARARGRQYSAQENMDDMVTLMMQGLSGGLRRQQQLHQQQGPGPLADGRQPPPDGEQQQQHEQQQQEVVLEKRGQGWEMRGDAGGQMRGTGSGP